MFLKWKSIKFAIISLLLITINLKAQDAESIKMSLTDALQLAKEKNFELKLAQAEVDKMSADKNKSLSVFLPQITVSETFTRTNDPLNVFAFKLKQQIITTADFNPAILNNPNEKYNFNTRIDINQPLINLDGFFGRAAAADGLSAMKYKRTRTENYISFMVKMNYYKLVLNNINVEILKKELENAESIRRITKNYYNEGLITKADYLMIEVYVSNVKSQLVEAKNNLEKTNDDLRLALGIESEKNIIPTDTLKLQNFDNLSFETKSIIENRSDMLAYKNKVSSLEKMNKMNWMKLVPRLNAFGSYEYNDTKFWGSKSNNWMVGINIQWNIFNGFQNIASIQKSKAELDIAETDYSKAKLSGINEINSSLRDLNATKAKLELAKSAVLQSEEAMRIINNRYNKGLEKTIDLVNAETNALNNKLNYWKTLYYYNVSVFKAELMLEKKLITN
ncbi:MAG: hypothetical protein COW08_03505 [Ignavibacteriales bacterium CG12_big_fil_rev_8_21_14_0_65_30_8]|nr:MAG: hypothetical protein COW08_03505 [Ignavibacteriales bacterium CG12_big_fil_rev_8_21_14_0_65_30_8]